MIEVILTIFALIFGPFAYMLWGENRIDASRTEASDRFEQNEKNLLHDIESYRCFTNNHPYVWGEVEYLSYKNEIIESGKWIFIGAYRRIPFPRKVVDFSIKIDNNKKSIYLASDFYSYNPESLKDYDEWLQSMSDVNKAIKEHKGSKFLA